MRSLTTSFHPKGGLGRSWSLAVLDQERRTKKKKKKKKTSLPRRKARAKDPQHHKIRGGRIKERRTKEAVQASKVVVLEKIDSRVDGLEKSVEEIRTALAGLETRILGAIKASK